MRENEIERLRSERENVSEKAWGGSDKTLELEILL